MTYDEAIAFWFGRINYEVRSALPNDLKLERMRALLRALGDPHERLRIVHVTGTKGKGSTCAMLANVLRSAGYQVGLFTSPHLVHVEERLQVNGVPITHTELAALVTQIAPIVEQMERTSELASPTFFELSAALCFLHFVYRRVEVAVIEVGLGGRYDSTNVCNPLLSVMTSIGFDHMAQLGNTLEAITYEKAGIIKRRVPVVSGVMQAGPQHVIADIAKANGTAVIQIGRDVQFQTRLNDDARQVMHVVTPRCHWPALTLGLLGEHQAANAAVAVAAVEQLRQVGLAIPDESVMTGLRDVHWPARVELASIRPAIVIDTAHNVPSAEALVKTLQQTLPGIGKKSVVFAVSSDKQYPEILRILGTYFDHFYLTQYSTNTRSVAPEKLAGVLEEVAPWRSYSIHQSASEAWLTARDEVSVDGLIGVTGSMFLAGELRDQIIAECQFIAAKPLN